MNYVTCPNLSISFLISCLLLHILYEELITYQLNHKYFSIEQHINYICDFPMILFAPHHKTGHTLFKNFAISLNEFCVQKKAIWLRDELTCNDFEVSLRHQQVCLVRLDKTTRQQDWTESTVVFSYQTK